MEVEREVAVREEEGQGWEAMAVVEEVGVGAAAAAQAVAAEVVPVVWVVG